MELTESTSSNSVRRGMDYYERERFVSWKKISATEYDEMVSGSSGNE